MNWYYQKEGKQLGPFDQDTFQGFINNGEVTEATFVWREGMSDWLPYHQAISGQAVASASPQSQVPPHASCCQCRRQFSTDEMIAYQNTWVCAECKPAFFQQIRESGQENLAGVAYAGFWIRLGAALIDGVVLWVVNTIVGLLFGVNALQVEPGVAQAASPILPIVQHLIALTYGTFFIGKFAATPGKMALGLRVIISDGSKVSYARALGRFYATILSGLILGIGYLMIAFDDQKRGLHDHICNTRVIRK